MRQTHVFEMTFEATQRNLRCRVTNMSCAETWLLLVPSVQEGEGELNPWLEHFFARGIKRCNTNAITTLKIVT